MDCWQRAGAAAELPLRGTADRPLGLPSSAAAAHGTGSAARAAEPPVTSMRHRISALCSGLGVVNLHLHGPSGRRRGHIVPSAVYSAAAGSLGRAGSVGHEIGKEHRPPRGNLCYMHALRAARRLRGVPAGTARRRNAAFGAGARHCECRAARSARRSGHATYVGGYPHRFWGRQCLSTCACEVPQLQICHMAPLGGPTARSRILAP